MKQLVPLFVQISLLLIVMSIGLRARWSDITYVLKQPRHLVRAFVAVNVVVPLVAWTLCRILPVDHQTAVGLVIMAASPLAPFAPGKMLKAGADRPYVDGVYLVMLIAAVFIVPATVAILSAISVHGHATISVGAVALFVAKSVLVPMVVALTISQLWPEFAKKAEPIARIVGYLLLLPIALLVILKSGVGLMSLIGDGTLVVITATCLAGIIAGHLLGGRQQVHRIALAQAAATRHPGIAALIAHQNTSDPKVTLAIMLFLLVSIVITMIYARWIQHRLPADA